MNGSAKIIVNYECHARTWCELKEGLIREFSNKFNIWQIHRKLQETKKKKKEKETTKDVQRTCTECLV